MNCDADPPACEWGYSVLAGQGHKTQVPKYSFLPLHIALVYLNKVSNANNIKEQHTQQQRKGKLIRYLF